MADAETNSTNLSFTTSTAESLEITWKISDYFSLPDVAEDYSLDSPSFVFANATWCLRLFPNKLNRTHIFLVRLHSLVSSHEIIYMFQAMLGNEAYFPAIYSKCHYEEYSEPFHWLPRRSEMINELASDGTLILMYHLIYEELIREDTPSQNVSHKIDNSKIYETENLQISSTISLKSSIARYLKINWKIPDYFSLPDTVLYSMKSSPFTFADAIWCLKLYPNGKESRGSTTNASLVRLDSLKPCHKIIYICDMAVENERFFNWFYSKFSFGENCELDNAMDERSQLFNFRSKIAPDGNVTLFWHILFEESAEEDPAVQRRLLELNCCKTVCEDLKYLLLGEQDVDLTLKVKDKKFKAHRNILRARSQVLYSMLTDDVIEENKGVVDLPDCDPLAMEQFLLYMYCGKADVLNDSNMLGLYYAADKFKMMHLKEECRDYIRKSVSCSNFCDVVRLALSHCDKNLLECAKQFYVNNAKEILSTAEWMSFLKENEVAANELFIKAYEKRTGEK